MAFKVNTLTKKNYNTYVEFTHHNFLPEYSTDNDNQINITAETLRDLIRVLDNYEKLLEHLGLLNSDTLPGSIVDLRDKTKLEYDSAIEAFEEDYGNDYPDMAEELRL